eukprot:358946-Chlamydomonas_euryale.AAC.2
MDFDVQLAVRWDAHVAHAKREPANSWVTHRTEVLEYRNVEEAGDTFRSMGLGLAMSQCV